MMIEDGKHPVPGALSREESAELREFEHSGLATKGSNSPFYRSKLGLALFFTPIMLAFLVAALAPLRGMDGAGMGLRLGILIAGYVVGIGPFWLIGMALALWADMSDETKPSMASASSGFCGAFKDSPAPLFWGSFLSLAGLVLFVIVRNMI